MDYISKINLKRKKIREIANIVRRELNIKTIEFPVLKVLEILVKKFSDRLYYDVLEDDEFKKMLWLEQNLKIIRCIVSKFVNQYMIMQLKVKVQV